MDKPAWQKDMCLAKFARGFVFARQKQIAVLANTNLPDKSVFVGALLADTRGVSRVMSGLGYAVAAADDLFEAVE